MGYYIRDDMSMQGLSTEETLELVGKRFLMSNPPHPYTYRPFNTEGIVRGKDYRYHADLQHLLADAPLGSFSYVWGRYLSVAEGTLRFALISYGPSVVYLNGKQVAKSDIFSERYRSKLIFDIPVQKGMNSLVLRFENTSGGFGGEFGTWVGKLDYYFLMPSAWEEQEGLAFSEPLEKELSSVEEENLLTLSWLPKPYGDNPATFDLAPVFPHAIPGQFFCAITSVVLPKEGTYHFIIKETHGSELCMDGKSCTEFMQGKAGTHLLSLICTREATSGWTFSLAMENSVTGERVKLINPVLKETSSYHWCAAGPFKERAVCCQQAFSPQFEKPFDTINGPDFWHLGGKGRYLRLYNDNPLFGHWNYPLGVTLYGLVEAERMVREHNPAFAEKISRYLTSHVNKTLETYDYGMWDERTLGGATAVHHLMTSLDSLDDCGSFGSAILEIAKDHEVKDVGPVTHVVGTYITKEQRRLADGTFFRKNLMHSFHENTLWADDLYMSIPFLCRYAAFIQDPSLLDDAAWQFLGFASYLYIPEKQVMSHVYDFERNLATGIPWGRGNGWVLFSLSELLSVLDKSHPKYSLMLSLFRNLCEGSLRLQDETGMWHQVLDMSSSYLETSCTAMFTCAFSRGVRAGWYEIDEPYRTACKKAWKAIQRNSLDKEGHVWGVCRGSEFSCSRRYYAQELLPRLDDTHGIGIVMLAGVEYERLLAFERSQHLWTERICTMMKHFSRDI
ncbi:glycoside hydrolase family 88 protein [uncultured Sphaerochaeta sp.]|uniref:glycoside hydrolase family 88/105 protein n=1 Tax=uncultured Sphaerochaeta sp. TaxID=886478 RepID=UPI002A0A8E18|nr:glycoside hydrolase family 88 protein [uncultured Sphaerochaeta sp.]